ncbi:rubredoxin [Lachnotalea glycerini]|jgi:rubredoxin|uniref:rubredoxin n=1 Tax=Lachnotalea glycerini TaxID=1763509 RepID=UPI000B976255|nr:rubredoxin [Lachnotalea glycerini]
MNINAFNNLSYGVYIITTWDEERPTGCTANCAMQIPFEDRPDDYICPICKQPKSVFKKQ